jgi:hypothetical protein
MVALLRPQPGERPSRPTGASTRPALRLVVDNRVAPGGTGGVSRWSAPVVDGGPSLAVTVVVAALVLGLLGLIRFVQGPVGGDVGGPGAAVETGTAEGPAVPGPGDRVIVAEPGDSLWSIAAELDPDGDPRAAVATLIEANGGPSLQIGQQIVIPQQLLD